jgi:hypothetical protein
MSQKNPDFEQFLCHILCETYEDMVSLAEKEATAVERRCYRWDPSDDSIQPTYRRYADQLKVFLMYVRSGVVQNITRGNRTALMNLIRTGEKSTGSDRVQSRTPFSQEEKSNTNQLKSRKK